MAIHYYTLENAAGAIHSAGTATTSQIALQDWRYAHTLRPRVSMWIAIAVFAVDAILASGAGSPTPTWTAPGW